MRRVTLEGPAPPRALGLSRAVANAGKHAVSMLAVPGGARDGDVRVLWLEPALVEAGEGEAARLSDLLLHMH